MKVKMNGTTEWTKQGGKHVDNVDTTSVFSIEIVKEFPNNTKFEIIEKMMNETTKALEKVSKK